MRKAGSTHLSGDVRRPAPIPRFGSSRSFRVRTVVVGATLITLLAVLGLAVSREVGVARRALPVSSRVREPAPSRPAFTPVEAAYIAALWPIHGTVERMTARFTLGQILFKTRDIGEAELKRRVTDALTAYRDAEARLRGLHAPPSLEPAHEEYLAAVRLFEQSATEIAKMFEDGRDEHFRAAYPANLDGSNKIRAVGARFWPEEFQPH
jgi:hypothetical protein